MHDKSVTVAPFDAKTVFVDCVLLLSSDTDDPVFAYAEHVAVLTHQKRCGCHLRSSYSVLSALSSRHGSFVCDPIMESNGALLSRDLRCSLAQLGATDAS